MPQQTSAATVVAAGATARWRASSAPIDMPTTTMRAPSAARAPSARPRPTRTSRASSVRARSAGVVPWPGRRTARTGKPAAASASPSGRISSGVAVKPWTSRQPSGRGPRQREAVDAGGGVSPRRAASVWTSSAPSLLRALLQVVHEGLHGVLRFCCSRVSRRRVLRVGEAGMSAGDALLQRDHHRVAARGVDLRRRAASRCVSAKASVRRSGDGAELRRSRRRAARTARCRRP